MFLASWVKIGRKFRIAEANQPLATETFTAYSMYMWYT
jgi:hypothetical protein